MSETKTKLNFHVELKAKMDNFAHLAYAITKKFPREEIYGITSQLRRASLSVILNYIEGYARMSDKSHRNFLLISFGSLKESEYLLEFSLKEGFLMESDYDKAMVLVKEIGAILWGTIKGLQE